MLKVKVDILPFLIFLTYLIFVKKIMIVSTCLISVVKYRDISTRKNLTYISKIILCDQAVIWHSILNIDVLCRIILEIKKLKYLNTLGNKFLEYEAKWIVIKISHNGKSELVILHCFFLSQLLISFEIT